MINPISFQSIPIINTPQKRQNAVKIAAPALITSSAVMLATKAPKGEINQLKMSTRVARAGVAGLITAAVVSALTLANKETVVQGVNKVKEIFRRNPAEKELDNTKPIEGNKTEAVLKEAQAAQAENKPEEANSKETPLEESKTTDEEKPKETSTNPFAENNQAKELDKSIIEAENLVNSKQIQQNGTNPATNFFKLTPNGLGASSSESTNPFAQINPAVK